MSNVPHSSCRQEPGRIQRPQEACDRIGWIRWLPGLQTVRRYEPACRCWVHSPKACPGSPGRILVIATREDVTIVRETRRLIGRHGAGTVKGSPTDLDRQRKE